jgi:group I intron endonuclease
METYIYTLKDPTNNHIRYVGKTINVQRRLSAHLYRAKKGKHHTANWIKSLLSQNLKPIIEVIEVCNKKNWQEREKYWIAFYRQKFDLTNFTDGGEGGATYGRLGRPWSKEQHENNRKARLGLKQSLTPEGRRKRAEGRRRAFDKAKKPVLQYGLDGYLIQEWPSTVDAAKILGLGNSDIIKSCRSGYNTCGGFLWRYKSDEVSQKIEYEKPLANNAKKIYQLDKNGNIIQEFKSIKLASVATNILSSSINNCLKQKTKSAGGFRWAYKETRIDP